MRTADISVGDICIFGCIETLVVAVELVLVGEKAS